MLTENIKIAFRAIWANKMRSVLTVLGIMIGVASVIAVVSLVQGMQYTISQNLQAVGSNFIEVFPDPGEQRNSFLQKTPDLTIDDANAVKRGTSAIAEFTPIYISSVDLKYADAHHRTQLYAVSNVYQEIVNHWVDRGRFFTSIDQEGHKNVCTIGRDIVTDLKLGSNPIGKVIQINNTAFTVVGIMEKKGGTFGNNQDDVVLIPFSTATVMFGSENMRKLVLAFQMRSGSDLDLAKQQVTDVLRAQHHLKKGDANDFRILAQEELMKTISTVLMNVTLIMAAVVGIALLVGGIGIMNIMLVSVTERTREIGIRKSIGARRMDVLVQFLIEAISLSALGGVIGVAGGYALATVARFGLKKFVELPPVHTPLWAILLAFTFCGFLGVLFGIYPAAKASKLDPIDALRYE